MKSGFWHVSLHPDDNQETAFYPVKDLWQFTFGIWNAPATFKQLMEYLVKGLTY
jgi:hypothetical protein